jgi:hypothetical protein
MNTTKTWDVAVEEEEKTKLDYELLDRLIDSIARDFSRKGSIQG